MTQRRQPEPASAFPQPALHAEIVRLGQEGRRLDVDRAKAFAAFDDASAFLFVDPPCASMAEYGLRHGHGKRATLEYVAAGRVMAVCPEAETRVLDGSLTVATLAILAPYFLEPDMACLTQDGEPMPHAEILAWAALRPDRELRRAVHRRREEVRTGQQVVTRTIHLTSQGVDDLERAQTLASRKARRLVTQSETVETVLRDYVGRHDDLEKKTGTRRSPPMPPRGDGGRHPRTIPAEVRRELMRRHGDVCAIEHCRHRIWLENAHHLAHALGGGNEIADQDRICTQHHTMKDSGRITWVPDEAFPGGGYYRARSGGILRLKPPRPDPRETGPPASEEPQGKAPGGSSREPAPEVPDRAEAEPPDRVAERSSRLVPSRVVFGHVARPRTPCVMRGTRSPPSVGKWTAPCLRAPPTAGSEAVHKRSGRWCGGRGKPS